MTHLRRCQYFGSRSLFDGVVIPVTTATLPWKPVRSESWIWKDVMAKLGMMKVDEWKFKRKPERERVICRHIGPLAHQSVSAQAHARVH